MNLETLRSFMEAAELRSLSQAAEKLHLSQPAISKQIRALEHQLGVTLLKRTHLGVKPTEAGCVLIERANRILSELQCLETDLQTYRTDKHTRLGALPSLALHVLPQKILTMQKRNWTTEVTVRNTSGELVQNLLQGEIEAALLESKYVKAPLWGKELLRESYYAVLPSGHPLTSLQRLTIHALSQEPLVVHPESCDIRNAITAAFLQHQVEPKIATELAFGESIPSYVAAGAGIAILPELTAIAASKFGLIVLPLSDFGIQRSISLAVRNRHLGERLLRAWDERGSST